MQEEVETLYQEAVALLKKLIATESFSRQEERTAEIIQHFWQEHGVEPFRQANNVWALNKHYDAERPTILLNSHHDTVKPNPGWTQDPFQPVEADGKLYGLGSNDAGGSLVGLMAAFRHFYAQPNLAYNLIIAATAEEEVSGSNGIELIYPELGPIAYALVGEPTQMQLAIAEKGLLVLDCVATGKAGHAARAKGDNAIYRALRDIDWFRTYQFPKISPFLGPVKMSVTVINAGTQHNVVPDRCQFTVDVRVTDAYTHEEILEIIRQHVAGTVTPRSTRLQSSRIDKYSPLVQAGLALGRQTYGSPTTSDQALIPAPSLKMGPGDSARSHTADEFIYLSEIREGIELYITLLNKVLQP